MPKHSIDAYRAVEPWSKFVNIVGIDVEPDPGDINDDGSIDVNDVTILVDLLLAGGDLPANADVNGDGMVNVVDVTVLIELLLNSK